MRLSGQCHAAISSTVSQAAPNPTACFSGFEISTTNLDRTLVELDRRIQKLESEGRADADTPRSAGTDIAPPPGKSYS